jgi:hypothetical protein
VVASCTARLKHPKIIGIESELIFVFLWISEQRTIISLNNISWFVFITYKKLLRAERTGFL